MEEPKIFEVVRSVKSDWLANGLKDYLEETDFVYAYTQIHTHMHYVWLH